MKSRKSTKNFLALVELVRYLRYGPRSVTVAENGATPDEWLESFVKLSQTTGTPDAPLEASSIYVVPSIISPARSMPIVRFLSWDRKADRERCMNGVVRWPKVSIDCFLLERDDLLALDACVRDLQEALSSFPLDASGLNLADLYPSSSRGEGEGEGEASQQPVGDSPPVQYWLHVGMSTSSLQGEFLKGSAARLEDAWLALWSEIESKRVQARRLSHVEEIYTLEPKHYAEALIRELANSDEASA